MTVSTRAAGARTGLQEAALVTGAFFLLAGALGFIPGTTSNYEFLGMAGYGSGALLLSLFQVSVLHHIVHLAFGAAGLLAMIVPGILLAPRTPLAAAADAT